ncbi:hypothetical protein KC19_4G153900 [Ceratodon purpureus]|uniref:Uncharacterized protein n=1 Tax=Ceratodon purpureus TaxID=3225 RepID=A0A8T0ICK8_CERPU|nr:hypothetical protein KC19_4G153900 [Ceratodon purpureus]
MHMHQKPHFHHSPTQLPNNALILDPSHLSITKLQATVPKTSPQPQTTAQFPHPTVSTKKTPTQSDNQKTPTQARNFSRLIDTSVSNLSCRHQRDLDSSPTLPQTVSSELQKLKAGACSARHEVLVSVESLLWVHFTGASVRHRHHQLGWDGMRFATAPDATVALPVAHGNASRLIAPRPRWAVR